MQTATFIFVTFNEPKTWVNECVKSLLNQSRLPNEIIHLDNSYNKDYSDLWKNYNSNISYKYIHLENKSFTEALNIGINNATGEIIFRQDPDDFSERLRVETILNFFDLNDVDIVSSRAKICNQAGITLSKTKLIKNIDFNTLSKGNPLIHGSIAFKKKSIIRIGLYNTIFRKTQDYELYFWALKNDLKIEFISDTLYNLRIHSESVSNNYKSALEQAQNSQIVKKISKNHNKFPRRLDVKSIKILKNELRINTKLLESKVYKNNLNSKSINGLTLDIILSFKINFFLRWIRSIIVSICPRLFFKIFY